MKYSSLWDNLGMSDIIVNMHFTLILSFAKYAFSFLSSFVGHSCFAFLKQSFRFYDAVKILSFVIYAYILLNSDWNKFNWVNKLFLLKWICFASLFMLMSDLNPWREEKIYSDRWVYIESYSGNNVTLNHKVLFCAIAQPQERCFWSTSVIWGHWYFLKESSFFYVILKFGIINGFQVVFSLGFFNQ